MSSRPDTAELRALGVAADVAELLVESDVLARVADHLVVITPEVDQVTGESRALVTFLTPSVRTRPELVEELAATAAARHPETDRLVLVLPPGSEPPTTPGGAAYMRYVLATDQLVTARPAPGWQVRRATAADADDVVPLFAAALVEGYGVAGATTEQSTVDEYAAGLFDQALEAGAVFVAHDADGFTGHATVLPDQDDLTGQDRLELFDQFVLPRAHGTPAGSLLTSAAVEHARQAGLPLRGYVSGGDAGSDAVYGALLAKGWRQDTTYWSLPLSSLPRPSEVVPGG
ncbi:GNAT family N-acetyltransferase [Saccharothrix isguenensis]